MPFDPRKGHAALRRGRFSQSQTDYFLTLTTEARLPGLTALPASAGISEELTRLEYDATWTVRCSCVMPDHLHLLIRLGERLSLERAVQRLKAKTGAALRLAGCTWARGFFDRRLRPDDERLGVFLYVFLNPYRAGLVSREVVWPHFRCSPEDWEWFRHELDRELPPPEWLR